jgi:hypothetical protein
MNDVNLNSFFRAAYNAAQGKLTEENKKTLISVQNTVNNSLTKKVNLFNEIASQAFTNSSQAFTKLSEKTFLGFYHVLPIVGVNPKIILVVLQNLFANKIQKQKEQNKNKESKNVGADTELLSNKPKSEEELKRLQRETKLKDLFAELKSQNISIKGELALQAGGVGFEDISEIVARALKHLGPDNHVVKGISEEDKKAWGLSEAKPSEAEPQKTIQEQKPVTREIGKDEREKLAEKMTKFKTPNKLYEEWDGQI